MWSPSADEVEHARRVIAAFDEAVADGRGVVTVEGRMIENLHVDNARHVLAVVDAIAAVATGNRGGHQDVPVDPVTIIEVTVDD